jgi:hypothetical protein
LVNVVTEPLKRTAPGRTPSERYCGNSLAERQQDLQELVPAQRTVVAFR